MREPTIAAGFAGALLELAVKKGANREVLLKRAQIDAGVLEDQDGRVPFTNYKALMRAGKELSNDQALALHFGEAFEFSELSFVGLMGMACETIADAFAQLDRYDRLIADLEVEGDPGGKRLVLSRIDGKVWLIDRRKNPNEFPEITESSLARMVCASRRMPGGPNVIREVHVTHPAPSYRAEYDRIFQLPVVFESDKNALLMSGDSWLSQKLAQQPRYVFGILSERAEALLRELEKSATVRGRVERQLMPILHTGEASMADVAGKMGVSRQTLFRRLKSEGTTFGKILDELRHRMALNYLSGKKVSITETAYLVGFSEAAAFSRAFKRWTGTNPREARRRG